MVMSGFAAAEIAVRTSFHSMHALALFQAQDSINSGNSTLLMIFVGIAAAALAAQAIAVVVAGFMLMKAQKEIMGQIHEIKGKAMPLIDSSQALIKDLTPEVKQITTKVHTLVTDLSPQVKEITTKVNTLVTDLTPEIKQITTKVHEISVKAEQISAHFEEIAGVAKDKVQEFSPTISAANVTLQEANETARAANQRTREQIDRVNGMVTGAIDATVQMGSQISHAITQPVREVSQMVSNAKASVGSAVSGAKRSVESMGNSTATFFSTLVNGAKGITATYFASKRKPERPQYPPASYRYNPAEAAPPTKHVYEGEDRFQGGI